MSPRAATPAATAPERTRQRQWRKVHIIIRLIITSAITERTADEPRFRQSRRYVHDDWCTSISAHRTSPIHEAAQRNGGRGRRGRLRRRGPSQIVHAPLHEHKHADESARWKCGGYTGPALKAWLRGGGGKTPWLRGGGGQESCTGRREAAEWACGLAEEGAGSEGAGVGAAGSDGGCGDGSGLEAWNECE